MALDLAALLSPAHTAVVTSEVQNGVVGERSALPADADPMCHRPHRHGSIHRLCRSAAVASTRARSAAQRCGSSQARRASGSAWTPSPRSHESNPRLSRRSSSSGRAGGSAGSDGAGTGGSASGWCGDTWGKLGSSGSGSVRPGPGVMSKRRRRIMDPVSN